MNRPLVVSLFLSVVPLLSFACTEDTSAPAILPEAGASATAPSASSSPSDAATPPVQDATLDAVADTGITACNALQNIAAEVQEMREATDPPVATGGTWADGTYVLVRMTEHTGLGGATGPTGKTSKATIRKAGDRVEIVNNRGANSKEGTESAVVSFQGTIMTTTTVCPGTEVDTSSYTATPNTLMVWGKGPIARVYTYEKR